MTQGKISALQHVTIIFDLDGTLVNTAPDLQAALNQTLKKHGHAPVGPEVSQSLIGRGAKAMLTAALAYQGVTAPSARLQLMFEDFLTTYTINIDTFSAPYPGCVAALDRLTEAGALLAICTNKTQRLADHLIQSLDMDNYFAAIVGADSVPNRKPHGDHIRETLVRAGARSPLALMIGDSETDERAARNAELPFLFVPFGYGPIGSPSGESRYVLDDFNKLTVETILKLVSDQAARL